jgi:hypothetical protein
MHRSRHAFSVQVHANSHFAFNQSINTLGPARRQFPSDVSKAHAADKKYTSNPSRHSDGFVADEPEDHVVLGSLEAGSVVREPKTVGRDRSW